jgi:hypothetical protein
LTLRIEGNYIETIRISPDGSSMDPAEKEPFHAILNRVVQNRTRELGTSPPRLAERLGPDYRTFMYWLAGERKFPAELLPALCIALDDYKLLDELEREVGRVAYRIPDGAHSHNFEDVKVVQELIKEVGGALEELSRTLEDGVVEKHELDKTLPELDDVIRVCARLKHWLERRHEADFPKHPRPAHPHF